MVGALCFKFVAAGDSGAHNREGDGAQYDSDLFHGVHRVNRLPS